MSVIHKQFGPFILERYNGVEYTLFWEVSDTPQHGLDFSLCFDLRHWGLGFTLNGDHESDSGNWNMALRVFVLCLTLRLAGFWKAP